MPALIQVNDLRRSFGRVRAVDGLSLSIDAGEVFALVGPDGAGKTTVMRLICGALRADSGSVLLAGEDLARRPEHARANLGYLPQRFSLYGELTVLENLRFFAELRGLPTREWLPRSREILDFVGLADFGERRAEALSGGMKQKLGLAAALVHRPSILLLDEPTGGVDPVTRQSFWQLIIRLLGQGVAVLVSTPYMDEAARCSRVGFMARGQLLLQGRPAEVVRSLQGRILEVKAEPRRRAEELAREVSEVEDVQAFGDRLHLRLRAGAGSGVEQRLAAQFAAGGVECSRMHQVPPNLEDVFIAQLQAEAPVSTVPPGDPDEAHIRNQPQRRAR